MKLVVDTNALLAPLRDGTDLHGEVERLLGAVTYLVPATVLQELDTLSQGTGRTARAAKAALRLAADMQLQHTDLPGDDGVLDVARRLGDALLTDDKRLIGEAKQAGLRVLRSRGHGLGFA